MVACASSSSAAVHFNTFPLHGASLSGAQKRISALPPRLLCRISALDSWFLFRAARFVLSTRQRDALNIQRAACLVQPWRVCLFSILAQQARLLICHYTSISPVCALSALDRASARQ